VRDRNDFKAADVKWTGVMGENYFTLLLADWVTKPNAIKSCFHDGAVGKPKVLVALMSVSLQRPKSSQVKPSSVYLVYREANSSSVDVAIRILGGDNGVTPSVSQSDIYSLSC